MGQSKKKGLGRGLSALIPPKPAEDTTAGPMRLGLQQVAVEDMLPSDAQPRQVFQETALAELAKSIEQHGILQPIVVRKRGSQYEIIAGERRWRAAQRAGLREVPVVISDIAEKDTLTIALVENVQREDLNAIEEAEAYHRLSTDLGMTQAEIADAVGKDRATVANSLRLLKLPETVRQLVLDDALSMGHARALLGLPSEKDIVRASREAVAKSWSVRQTEKFVAAKRAPAKDAAKKATAPNDAYKDVRMRLQRTLGTKVELREKNGSGSIQVHFGSLDELNSIIDRIGA